ncbi:urea ABC transporter ATP-binding subunit UrtE [Halovibrio salipaludis]|uniref:Urea ABC transporter ATP-binding subunit UrtE n=1 Tax=Halovibrio salipaludis TaxID=2032626 RepID=A0A2A2EQY7_9GAMM|nr:urea ABC transporter ATP-binding subunit UrtE [Halovibrio salipaludis]PAU75851.1 urea ABC transporter ATP-binding subunit UrtE [Halovibrio salipaludis]
MLKVNDLSIGYGLSQVVHDINLELGKGEILGVMGRNGMGKTTLFKALIGLLPSWSGDIQMGGVELTGERPYRRVASGLAYVPQGRQVFATLTVEENIRTGLEATGQKKIPDDIYSLFPVLQEMRKRRAGNLSGGQQQQLAIARALAAEPDVLLLDEPTEGIQPSIIKDMAKTLREIRQVRNISILFSEQVLSFAMDVSDRVLVMDRGKLVDEMQGEELSEATMAKYLSV